MQLRNYPHKVDSDFKQSKSLDSTIASLATQTIPQVGLGCFRMQDSVGMMRSSLTSFLRLSTTHSIIRWFFPNHDEAGNAGGTARTILVAVNHAPLFGPTRTVAKARCRLCYGLSLLSAATPMFFIGEEVGSQQPYRFDSFIDHRENIIGLRNGIGGSMFHFYQDLISLRKRLESIRSHNINILHKSNRNLVIAFKRWSGNQEVIVVASLNNSAFSNGYTVLKDTTAISNTSWKEVFNSDSAFYDGENIGNNGKAIQVTNNRLSVVLPANGFVVFVRQ